MGPNFYGILKILVRLLSLVMIDSEVRRQIRSKHHKQNIMVSSQYSCRGREHN